MKNILSIAVCCSLLLSCKDQSPNKVQQLKWLEGSWQEQRSEGLLTEEWTSSSDTLMIGKAALYDESGHSIFSDNMELSLEDNILYFKPTVSNQNNGAQVVFKETMLTDKEVIFENPDHDFPKRIIYRKNHPDSLFARIEGTKNGVDRAQEFHYHKR